MAKWLSKSDYQKFLIHPAYLWLQKHDKDKLPGFDEQAQAIMDQGQEVDELARSLFPEGQLVNPDLFAGLDDTSAKMRTGSQVLFQPAVLTQRSLYARADIMTRNPDGSWKLIEVKSSTKVKPPHITDLAFQKAAFEEAGYAVGDISVIHINNSYVRKGPVEPDKLLMEIDVTERVAKLQQQTSKNIDSALKVVAQKECPDDSPLQCVNYYAWRSIYRYLHPEMPANSIYNLARLTPDQLKELARLGVTELEKIPATLVLRPQQISQLTALKAGKPIVRLLKIAHELNKLKFPLYFFDYETYMGAVPPYDRMRPYQQIPFQYSLHVLEASGELGHKEFLYEGNENPMPPLLEQLVADIGPEGTVVAWNKSFEMGVNRQLAQWYPQHKTALQALNKRIYDLMEIFARGYYADHRFMGSASIKKVLPVLVPELNYADLEIGEGGTASTRWGQAWKGGLAAEERQQLFEHLRVYCAQDTLAMVKIYQFLAEAADKLPKQESLL